MNLPVALQLYTLRDECAKDFVGTLKQVAEIGYEAVELAGLHQMPAPQLKAVVDDLGLKVISSHVPLADMEQTLSQVFEDSYTLGNKYIVMPWLPEDRRNTEQDWRKLAETLNGLGAKCQTEGFMLCYHNHDFEFQTFSGKTAYEIIFDHVDPQWLSTEIDVYWVTFAGGDPVTLIERFAGRAPLIHIKDMTRTTPPTYAEVGEGSIDFRPIFEAANKARTEWFIVEQDKCERPPLESVKLSLRNLQTMTA